MDVQSEQDQYKAIVAEVKADFAKLNRKYAGDEVQHEIAKRWAKAKGRPFNEPAPPTPDGVPFSAVAPTAPGHPNADQGKRLKTPGVEYVD